MTESAATSLANTVPTGPDRTRARCQRPIPIKRLPRQIARAELAERIDGLPSREGKRAPRSDLLDNVGRFYDALWRHARARGTGRYRLTARQLALACGYEEWTYRNGTGWLTSLTRYRDLLEEAGLARISGRDDFSDGRTCVVTLLEPPERLESAAEGRRSSAGDATSCWAVRRRETRPQRIERRVRPWCPKGGRGRATERWVFSFGPYVGYQGSVPPTGEPSFSQAVRAREAAADPGRLSDAPPPPAAMSEREAVRAAIAASLAAAGGGGNVEIPPSPPIGSLDRGAAFEAARTAAGRGGAPALRELAGQGLDPLVLGIVAWELLFDGPPRLTGKRRGELLRAAAIIDRVLEEPGAGGRHLLLLMGEHAERLRLLPSEFERPGSLAFFVTQLRADARHWRRGWRARRATAAQLGPRADRSARDG